MKAWRPGVRWSRCDRDSWWLEVSAGRILNYYGLFGLRTILYNFMGYYCLLRTIMDYYELLWTRLRTILDYYGLYLMDYCVVVFFTLSMDSLYNKDIKSCLVDEQQTWAKISRERKRVRCNLVGGLEHQFYFPIYWEFHHPNDFHIFQRGAQPPTSNKAPETDVSK